jgi:hypothetical protein
MISVQNSTRDLFFFLKNIILIQCTHTNYAEKCNYNSEICPCNRRDNPDEASLAELYTLRIILDKKYDKVTNLVTYMAQKEIINYPI